MNLALKQAHINLGNTKENPSVGCVIVKNGSLVSAGHTSHDGRPHAESNAINFSKVNLTGSTIYVTMEPCSHYGKTPPCIKSIINKKIGKVYFSIKDPDIRSFDKSSKKFNDKNVLVNKGLLNNKINLFYKSYIMNKINDLPFVTCKLAVSKDFFTINKKKRWITNEHSRNRVHLMRSMHDCIMTSSSTVINDNPMLTCRINGLNYRSPSRIILDNNLKIRTKSKICKDAKVYQTIIFYNKANIKKISLFKKLNIKTFQIPLDENKNLDLNECLKKAKQLGFTRIFLESGIKLVTSFLKMDLIDDFNLFISCKKIKINGSRNFKNTFMKYLNKKKKRIVKVNLFGEKLVSYNLK